MKSKHLIALLAVVLLLPPMGPAGAAVYTETADTNITVGSHTLKIMEGSVYESLSVDSAAGTLTVTVPDGEGFDLRYPGPFPYGLENGGYADACNVLTTRDNQLFISGGRTVTVSPNNIPCDTSNAGNDDTTFYEFSVPGGGESYGAGDVVGLFWTRSGDPTTGVNLRLSLDDGASFQEPFVQSIVDDGYYYWTVPEIAADASARLKIEGLQGDRMVSLEVGPAFTIRGTGAAQEPGSEPTEPESTYDYDPAAQTSAAATISDDKGLIEADLPSGTVTCLPNSRIKPASSSAVYYCGVDGKRYVFPNAKTHDTWYSSFNGVIELDDATISQIPLGGNVTYRPGVKLVKIQTDPKVYAVAGGGVLRWIKTEAAARALYGDDWNQKVDDVPDAFFVNYVVGEPIE